MSSPQSSLLELRTGSLAHLRRFADGQYLYAILDAYDNPSVPDKMKEIGKDRGVCLFTGEAGTKYWGLAPYLAAVDADLLDWIIQSVWKAPWGVFVLSKTSLDVLGPHLRRFLMVQLPDGERWYFRYYDPRILKIYLSNCVPQELRHFFGPVRGFAIPNAEAESEEVSFYHFQPSPADAQDAPEIVPPLVRREHFETIQQAVVADFEERTLSFLSRAHPHQAGRLGRDGLRELIQYGSARAAQYQIVGEDERSQFIELMLMLGRNFDQDPNSSWAQKILRDTKVPDLRERISRLREAAKRLPAS